MRTYIIMIFKTISVKKNVFFILIDNRLSDFVRFSLETVL